MVNNKIKVAFFDVDGLLVDSEKVFIECWIEASELIGLPISRNQAYELRSLDSSLANDLFFSWFNREDAYGLIRAKRKELMNDKLKNQKLEVKPGITEIINSLCKNGVSVAIVTSASEKRAKDYLKSVGLDYLFDLIISTESVAKGKPFPDVYKFAAKKMNCKAENCIAFEDSPNGVKSAHSAGCVTIMIPDLTKYDDSLEEYVDYWYISLNAANDDLDRIISR